MKAKDRKVLVVEELKEIYDLERKRRVIIYRHDLDTFGYEQEYFSEDPFEMCWIPAGRAVNGIYDSAERAEIEVRSNIDWLKDLDNVIN